MRILTNGLPTAISVNGQVCNIRADYQTCIRIIMAFEDTELMPAEKAEVLLKLLYIDSPVDLQTALKKGLQFLDCGDERETDEEGTDSSRKYSFSKDEKYIFAGVNKVLNGRLSKGDFVHWWEFALAFMDLPEDCMMSKILYYRTQYAKGKLTREEKMVWAKNRDIFELEETQTAEEKEKYDNFMNRLGKND